MALFPNEHETIEGVGRALRAGRTTCVEILGKCLDRIEEWEPRIKAWVKIDRDAAFDQARALDQELAAGHCRGPLHGIPVGIKDIIDVAGLPTAAGFGPWRDRAAATDAPLVEALRKAGAVIVGKTVTTPFAWIDPPPTRNPWNLERTPGGSSSGSAAAVAVGMVLGALGTQTGGSIIRPASFCGVCGIKPTHGKWPDAGIFPFAPSLDHPGPIARSTRDLTLIVHELDTWCDFAMEDRADQREEEFPRSPNRAPGDVDAEVAVLLEGRITQPRLGRLRGFFDERVDPEMRRAVDAVLATLAEAGAEVIDVSGDPFDFETIVRQHRVIMAAEAAAGHEARFATQGDDYPPRIRALVEEGLSLRATDYVRAKQDQETRIGDLLAGLGAGQRVDALVMPATVGAAPSPETTGDPALNAPWSYLGFPVVSFPIALTADGLPLALQLVARSLYAENDLLGVAMWCEDAIRHAARTSARSD